MKSVNLIKMLVKTQTIGQQKLRDYFVSNKLTCHMHEVLTCRNKSDTLIKQ